jgi:Family of unknown function (DUF5906)
VAARLKDIGNSQDLAQELMLEHYNPRCEPEWSPDELATKVRNAYSYARNKTPGEDSPRAEFDEIADADEAHPSDRRSSADAAVEETNRTYFTVLHGGKYRVGRERIHPTLGFLTVDWCSDEDIRKHLNTRSIEVPQPGGGSRQVKLGKLWTEHPGRRRYEGVVFDPSPRRHHEGMYNLWRGWAVEPKPGDWSLMKRLIKDVLCAGDQVCYEYVVRWCAFLVQRPEVPAEVVLVFRGRKGRGKGTFCRALVELAGKHGHQIANSQHFVGRFNEHLMDCIVLFVDEGFWAGDKRAEGVLKNLVTERTLTFEPKGMPVVRGPNLLHIVMASNEDWVVPATEDERRFAVFDACEAAYQALSAEFWEELNVQMDQGGREAMLHELLHMQLGDWHPRKSVPRTKALLDQKVESLRQDPLKFWWHTVLERGSITYVTEDGGWDNGPVLVGSEGKGRLLEALNGTAHTLGRRSEYTKKKLASFLKQVGIDIEARDRRGNRVWVIPKLESARSAFETWIGGKVDWD